MMGLESVKYLDCIAKSLQEIVVIMRENQQIEKIKEVK